MVVVNVLELLILYGIKLDRKEMIFWVTIIRAIEKAKILARRGAREILVGTKSTNARPSLLKSIVGPHNGEKKSCGEGCQGGAIRRQVKRVRVESVTFIDHPAC